MTSEADATAKRPETYASWMWATTLNLAIVTLGMVYAIATNASAPTGRSFGSTVAYLASFLLVIPYAVFTYFAFRSVAAAAATLVKKPIPLVYRALMVANVIAFVLDAYLLLLFVQFPIGLLTFIPLTALIAITVIGLPIALFGVRSEMAKNRRRLTDRLDELQRLKARLLEGRSPPTA